MLKPVAFQYPHIAFRNIPYACTSSYPHKDSVHSGGVIGRGQTVWVETPLVSAARQPSALVYVENVGIVSLDPRWLVEADIFRDGVRSPEAGREAGKEPAAAPAQPRRSAS